VFCLVDDCLGLLVIARNDDNAGAVATLGIVLLHIEVRKRAALLLNNHVVKHACSTRRTRRCRLADVVRRGNVLLTLDLLAACTLFRLLVAADIESAGAVLQKVGHLLLRGILVDVEEPIRLHVRLEQGVGGGAAEAARVARDSSFQGGIEGEWNRRGKAEGRRIDTLGATTREDTDPLGATSRRTTSRGSE
jgi:hypothetical protein